MCSITSGLLASMLKSTFRSLSFSVSPPPFICPWPQILVTLAPRSYRSCGVPTPLPGATAAAAPSLHKAQGCLPLISMGMRCQPYPGTPLLSSCGQVFLLTSSHTEVQWPPAGRGCRAVLVSAFSTLLIQPQCGNKSDFPNSNLPMILLCSGFFLTSN